MKNLSMLLLALAGCTVMVNGKPRRIGGGPDPAPTTPQPVASGRAQQPATQAAQQQPPRAADAPQPRAPGQVIKADFVGRDPLVVSLEATLDTTWSKVFGRGTNSPNCGIDLPSQPIAAFELTKPDHELTISLVGGGNDGFVVRGEQLFWTTCTSSIGDAPTMAPVKDGWQPGRYFIYPVARYSHGKKPLAYTLEMYRPNAAVTVDDAQPLVIGGKFEKPMFVEITLKPNRRKLRGAHSGSGCDKVALPSTPDIALTIERPIPGLTFRPLPTVTPVTMRLEKPAEGKQHARKYCSSRTNASGKRYSAPSELRFDKNDEGSYGISFGTPDGTDGAKVTVMVFDDSTKFEEMYVRPFGGEQPALEQRWIGYQMPQLSTGDLGTASTYADAERTARVFAAVPKQALVYAKLTFDKDIGGGDGFPVKNEPLVLLGLENERATVLTADGMRFHVKASHLVLDPDGPMALPAAPRPGRKLEIGGVIAMLSPAQKKLGEAHHAKVKARDACLDRAWEPYRRQLPSITRPAGVDIVVYKSARTKAIEEAGERAMDKQCGTDAAFARKTEATRAKLAIEVEKNRAKLLAEATAKLR